MKPSHMAVGALTFLLALADSLVWGANFAVQITFEGEDSLTNVSPDSPYVDQGFSFVSTTDQSAVFDSGTLSMPGNSTDFLGWNERNQISILGPSSFDLISMDIGPSALAALPAADITITGTRTGGRPNLVSSNIGVSTLQTVVLNWMDLTSVVIVSTDDAGIDNVNLRVVPEPSAILLLGLSGVAIAFRRLRQSGNRPRIRT